ncbi:MAG: hypothetical protein L0Z73_11030 [Gammaproteobacteria bacterium]|nr:hypothetical protein [Gammaproteobacteria bacterium]
MYFDRQPLVEILVSELPAVSIALLPDFAAGLVRNTCVVQQSALGLSLRLRPGA